jgi:hypothetical protein
MCIWLMAVFWIVAPCVTLMVKAVQTSETLENLYQSTRLALESQKKQLSSYSPRWEPEIMLHMFAINAGKFLAYLNDYPPLNKNFAVWR